MGEEVMENGEIIDAIERMASETEQLAVGVNNEMSCGTRALGNAKRSVGGDGGR